MSKKISKIWSSKYYTVNVVDGKRKATCNFCRAKTYTDNASKMQDHLLKCEQVDEETKSYFQPSKRFRQSNPNPSLVQQSTASTSAASLDSIPLASSDAAAGESLEEKPETETMQPARKQISVEGFLDRMSQDEQDAINKSFAQWIYAANLPLSVTDNPYFSDFVQKVRPAWKYPSRFQLTNKLLDSEVQDADALKAQAIATANAIVLLSDGWTSVKGKSLINFVAVCDHTPIYLDTVDTKADNHTGAYIAELLKTKINDIGPNKVYALCTDNAANMKLAWSLLKDEFPSLVCFGCAAHGLSLYAKDIAKIPEIKTAACNANMVLKWLKFKHLPHAILNEKCKEIHNRELAIILSVETRWGSVFYSLNRLLQLRNAIEQTVMDLRLRGGQSKVPENIRQFVLDDVFWQDIEAVVHLLRPLAKAILLTEGDNPQPGLICHIFQQMKVYAEEANEHTEHFGRDVQQQLLNIWQNRADFCLSDIHFAANILDPRFRGELLSEEEDIKGMQFIADTASKMTGSVPAADLQTRVFVQLGEFKTMTGAFSHEFKWQAAKTMHPAAWWNTFHSKNPLSKIARKILNVTPTAASAERNWKRHALTQTKLRNRLTEENLQKLVHVSSALTLKKKQNQDLTNRIAELLKNDFDVIHGGEDKTRMDEADAHLLMELMDAGQFDTGDLEMSCDEIEEDVE